MVKIIKSYVDCNKLSEMGNKMLYVDRDRNNRSRLIFVFEMTEKILSDLREIEKERDFKIIK